MTRRRSYYISPWQRGPGKARETVTSPSKFVSPPAEFFLLSRPVRLVPKQGLPPLPPRLLTIFFLVGLGFPGPWLRFNNIYLVPVRTDPAAKTVTNKDPTHNKIPGPKSQIPDISTSWKTKHRRLELRTHTLYLYLWIATSEVSSKLYYQ